MKPTALATLSAFAACAGAPRIDGPPLEIPSYSADDPRPQTGGFVRQVRLAEVEQDGTRFILMAFEVGDTLTLGAMTEGPFSGVARWSLDEAVLETRFDPEPASGEVGVATPRKPAEAAAPSGQKAGFRGFQWINMQLPTATWMSDRVAPLSLSFVADGGRRVSLPAEGRYTARIVAR